MNRGLWDFSYNRKLLCFVILICSFCHKSREFDERIFFTKQPHAVYNKFTRNLLVFTPSVQTENPFLLSFFYNCIQKGVWLVLLSANYWF